MIPPPPGDLLVKNPNFAILHKQLSEKYLDATDGSTRRLNERHQTEVEVELGRRRVEAVKGRVLLCAMEGVRAHIAAHGEEGFKSGKGSGEATSTQRSNQRQWGEEQAPLPNELLDLLATVILPYITHSPTLTPDEHALLYPELARFRTDYLAQLGEAVSQHLTALSTRLTTTVSNTLGALPPQLQDNGLPHGNATTATTTDASLAHHLQTLTHYNHTLLHIHLPLTLLTLTASSTTNLETHAQHLLQVTLPELEQLTHGARPRHLLGRAAFDAAVARGLGCKAGVAVLEGERDLDGDDGGVGTFAGRMHELDEEKRGFRLRERQLKGILAEYEEAERSEGAGMGKGMQEEMGVLKRLGRRYGEVQRGIGEGRGDVDDLLRKIGEEQGKGKGGRHVG